MRINASALPVRRGERLFVELAVGPEAVRQAQALRYRIFGEEMGAKLKQGHAGLDVDDFDAYCHHLLVRETKTGAVVGCTRLLNSADAHRTGGFYSESEFDLGAIPRLPGKLLEVGRTCVSAQCRQGAVIAVLWSGIAGYVQLHGIDYLFGCASVPLGEGDLQAAAIMNRLRRQAMAPPELRATPKTPLRCTDVPEGILDAPLPALLKAYVRLGARACGEACRDPDFEVGDVLMLLKLSEINPAYARHFLERVGEH
ncbi:MAG: GNAT family N-acetyltransferase [Thiohalocapsa sp.]|jgi:putative hemolysin|uniref:GNAT family N-acetyltransferase n=1 Tax=Thiohalocapsa sp. TaxID=2497641 RepID=UPI0025ECA1E1|nr:GNAT family N-acyltransferase [Thiohalocapsa sp.]MCG6943015.1 GNAT family N-acetyltransferase [Thiohalocapsa sp.]